MAGEKEKVDAYLDTINRIEPDIAMLDQGAALASIAISLRRIADVMEGTPRMLGIVDHLTQKLDTFRVGPLR